MTSPLDNLCGPTGDLAHEAPDEEEYAHHIDNGLKKLHDARNRDLYLVSRFDLAYNAAFHLSLAALHRLGYRPRDKRYIVFQALPHTLQLGTDVWRVLNNCHDIRNSDTYRITYLINEKLIDGLIAACQKVADKLSMLHPVHANDTNEASPQAADNEKSAKKQDI